ncbi:glutathione S-transferase [Rhodobacteraceae bacterium B1Z28]|uniref:Glutathione S-transferase n=1 Tax=Ruegeria haliotis TaxID=2747601 RepID=A0ABX2PT76_9RHOB|nr:glutathione S-transferase [Ruegeria haliotis]NVO56900.1 glutathione S-transferase [Ruegeria haliotis]
MVHHPIFWTFRRCPYAIRARLALLSSGVRVELREILLRDKPAAFLQTSPSGTVPALRLPDQVLDESLEIMIWALQQNDPQRLLDMPQAGWDLIEVNDGPFKAALDHTKYATRYPGLDPKVERKKAASYLLNLDERLAGRSWLFGSRPTIADLALLPFVRQFAHIDRMWFDGQEWLNLISWLNRFIECEAFLQVMNKNSPWSEGDAPTWFNS